MAMPSFGKKNMMVSHVRGQNYKKQFVLTQGRGKIFLVLG